LRIWIFNTHQAIFNRLNRSHHPFETG
jgi:hypothetical protein